MREWLEQWIPEGSRHSALVDLASLIAQVGGVLLWFLVLRWLLIRGLRILIRPLLQASAREGETNLARARTLEGLAYSSVTYSLLFVAAVTVLDQLGVNVGALLAGAGVAGLALSFGAQRLVRDILTGFFLLLEDQYRVGETVTILIPPVNHVTGQVEQIGLRTTRLRDPTGKTVIVNNGDVTMVVNHNRGPVETIVDIGVHPEASLDGLRSVIEGTILPGDLFTAAPSLQGVTEVDANRVVVRVAAPAAPGKSAEGELVLRQAASDALRVAGIEVR